MWRLMLLLGLAVRLLLGGMDGIAYALVDVLINASLLRLLCRQAEAIPNQDEHRERKDSLGNVVEESDEDVAREGKESLGDFVVSTGIRAQQGERKDSLGNVVEESDEPVAREGMDSLGDSVQSTRIHAERGERKDSPGNVVVEEESKEGKNSLGNVVVEESKEGMNSLGNIVLSMGIPPRRNQGYLKMNRGDSEKNEKDFLGYVVVDEPTGMQAERGRENAQKNELGSSESKLALNLNDTTRVGTNNSAEFEKGVDLVFAAYLFSPIHVATCAARDSCVFTFAACLTCMYLAKQDWGRGFIGACSSLGLAGACLGVIILLEGPVYLTALGIPIFVGYPLKNHNASKALPVLTCFTTLAALLYWKHQFHSWPEIIDSYMWIYEHPDLKPNVGMWWYFVTEIFDRYRPYFLLLLHSYLFVCAGPVALNFYHRPFFHSTFSLAMLFVFQPKPALFHQATAILLILANPGMASQIPLFAPLCLVWVFAICMQPMMLHTWIDLRSGNANYYYFQCLIANGMVCTIIIQAASVVVRHDSFLRRVDKID